MYCTYILHIVYKYRLPTEVPPYLPYAVAHIKQ